MCMVAKKITGKTWNRLVLESGYPVRVHWTKELLRSELRHWHRTGRCSLPGVSYSTLYQAAYDEYGSLWQALRAAGISVQRPVVVDWSRAEVIRRVRARLRRRESISSRAVFKADKNLYKRARRHLGKPWIQAMRDLGYDCEKPLPRKR